MTDLRDAAQQGRTEGLEALRDVLAVAIAADDGKQTAALARQLRDVLRDLDEIKRAAGRKGSLVDELANRRAKAGGAGAAGARKPVRRRAKPGA